MPLLRKSRCPPNRRCNPLLLDCRLKLRTCQRRTRCMRHLSLPRARPRICLHHIGDKCFLMLLQWKPKTCQVRTACRIGLRDRFCIFRLHTTGTWWPLESLSMCPKGTPRTCCPQKHREQSKTSQHRMPRKTPSMSLQNPSKTFRPSTSHTCPLTPPLLHSKTSPLHRRRTWSLRLWIRTFRPRTVDKRSLIRHIPS